MPKNPHANFTPSLDGYSGQGALKFWCQLALPLVYDDSLSFYELLNKVVKYLNNTIKDVALVEGKVEYLGTEFDKLYNYVHDYFDNLDVEDELWNIFNEMYESGELAEIIEPYVSRDINNYITPEMFGAVGDGETDDSQAFANMFADGTSFIMFKSGATYLVTEDVNGLAGKIDGKYINLNGIPN